MVKNLLANAGDSGSVAGSGRSPREGNDNPVQYSWMEEPGGLVHGAAELDMAVCLLPCPLFIHSSVSGCLGCFYPLVIANNTTMNMGVQTAL